MAERYSGGVGLGMGLEISLGIGPGVRRIGESILAAIKAETTRDQDESSQEDS